MPAAPRDDRDSSLRGVQIPWRHEHVGEDEPRHEGDRDQGHLERGLDAAQDVPIEESREAAEADTAGDEHEDTGQPHHQRWAMQEATPQVGTTADDEGAEEGTDFRAEEVDART